VSGTRWIRDFSTFLTNKFSRKATFFESERKVGKGPFRENYFDEKLENADGSLDRRQPMPAPAYSQFFSPRKFSRNATFGDREIENFEK